MILRCGTICECTSTVYTLVRDDRDSQRRSGAVIAAFVVCLMCKPLFQLVKTSPHLPFSPSSSQTYLSTPSLSNRGIVLSVRVSHNVLFENAAVRISLKSVRWKESLTSSSSKIDITENVFPPGVRKNPPCQTAPQTSASLRRKPLRMGSLLGTELLRPSVSLPHLKAVPIPQPLFVDVRGCAPSLSATFDSSDCDFCSCW